MGTVYRAHNPRWSFLPLSGDGAARHGGRFNPAGMRALYASRRVETAWREAQQGLPFKAQPLTICAYDVNCARIADLTDQTMLAAFSMKASDLAYPWEGLADQGIEPPTWRLARRLLAAE